MRSEFHSKRAANWKFSKITKRKLENLDVYSSIVVSAFGISFGQRERWREDAKRAKVLNWCASFSHFHITLNLFVYLFEYFLYTHTSRQQNFLSISGWEWTKWGKLIEARFYTAHTHAHKHTDTPMVSCWIMNKIWNTNVPIQRKHTHTHRGRQTHLQGP